MLQILLDIAEVLFGFVAAVFVLVTVLIIIGQFVRGYRERRGANGIWAQKTPKLKPSEFVATRANTSRQVLQAGESNSLNSCSASARTTITAR